MTALIVILIVVAVLLATTSALRRHDDSTAAGACGLPRPASAVRSAGWAGSTACHRGDHPEDAVGAHGGSAGAAGRGSRNQSRSWRRRGGAGGGACRGVRGGPSPCEPAPGCPPAAPPPAARQSAGCCSAAIWTGSAAAGRRRDHVRGARGGAHPCGCGGRHDVTGAGRPASQVASRHPLGDPILHPRPCSRRCRPTLRGHVRRRCRRQLAFGEGDRADRLALRRRERRRQDHDDRQGRRPGRPPTGRRSCWRLATRFGPRPASSSRCGPSGRLRRILHGCDGADPSSVIFDAVQHAAARGADPGAGGHRRAAPHQGQPDGGAAEGAPGGREAAWAAVGGPARPRRHDRPERSHPGHASSPRPWA